MQLLRARYRFTSYWLAHHADNVPDLIKNVGGAPVVIKLLEVAQEYRVVLGKQKKTLKP